MWRLTGEVTDCQVDVAGRENRTRQEASSFHRHAEELQVLHRAWVSCSREWTDLTDPAKDPNSTED